ncbi:hypothetical protein L8R85_02205 [Vibrio splendidus]|uniref:Uncharacterized protein n=2 Tax=Vibrio TaxID=662 RepID=A0A4R3PDN9_9VIBR|nr:MULTISPECIES: hypothetical protein [Vibrio]MDH5919829.1 hypothetical protein [Vibrio splendidus]TCN05640.1 hypothetical protein EDB35_116138 [Vibrio crassostreae]TCT46146.1 hypothetical protein EDB39_11418 [Vibrio crassostreae]TCT54247.1 hypothetical protein EDB40_114134 [Vibrio crassostreae]TCT58886.1 hypothetical protein EDB44_11821 [Vibrio crassostreae]
MSGNKTRLIETSERADFYFNFVEKLFTRELIDGEVVPLSVKGEFISQPSDVYSLYGFLEQVGNLEQNPFSECETVEALLNIEI